MVRHTTLGFRDTDRNHPANSGDRAERGHFLAPVWACSFRWQPRDRSGGDVARVRLGAGVWCQPITMGFRLSFTGNETWMNFLNTTMPIRDP